jgi:hypothetical protein
VALCARMLAVSMRELAVPRWSDVAAYGRAARSLLHRRRTPGVS